MFNSRYLGVIERNLDVAWLRQEVISNNIANVDTPGYKASKVKFDTMLNQSLGMRKTSHKHISERSNGLGVSIIQNSNTSIREDGNNVDVDAEMISLTKNTILYNTLIQNISSELSRIRLTIREGR